MRLTVDADYRGLTPETRALLAEPFQGAKGSAAGPSLGLSASLGLLRTLGADVQLDEANGCTQVDYPRGRAAHLDPDVAAQAVSIDRAARPPGARRRATAAGLTVVRRAAQDSKAR